MSFLTTCSHCSDTLICQLLFSNYNSRQRLMVLGSKSYNVQCISQDWYKLFHRDESQQGCVYWENSPGNSDMFHQMKPFGPSNENSLSNNIFYQKYYFLLLRKSCVTDMPSQNGKKEGNMLLNNNISFIDLKIIVLGCELQSQLLYEF